MRLGTSRTTGYGSSGLWPAPKVLLEKPYGDPEVGRPPKTMAEKELSETLDGWILLLALLGVFSMACRIGRDCQALEERIEALEEQRDG